MCNDKSNLFFIFLFLQIFKVNENTYYYMFSLFQVDSFIFSIWKKEKDRKKCCYTKGGQIRIPLLQLFTRNKREQIYTKEKRRTLTAPVTMDIHL